MYDRHSSLGDNYVPEALRYEARMHEYICNTLDKAIEEGWVYPLYQPIVRAATGAVCCEEALVRWSDPIHGELMPGQVVGALEDANRSHELDRHVMHCVVNDLKERERQGVSPLPVSLNLSPADFEHMNVVAELVECCDRVGVPRRLVCIELRESMAITNVKKVRKYLKELRSAGFEVWMDDFGRNLTSLGALRDLEFDLIKMDMELRTARLSSRAKHLFEGVVQTATRLGTRTLAEGVETREQVEFLESIGCNYLQGHYFAHPLRLDVSIAHAKAHDGLVRERLEEQSYWNAVSMLNLWDLPKSGIVEEQVGVANQDVPLLEMPAGVIEHRDGTWRVLRANSAYRSFLSESGLVLLDGRTLDSVYFVELHDVEDASAWTRITGRLEHGSKFQFFARGIASTDQAQAFVVCGLPTMLGTALGSYGDVPVAYAVFRVVLNEEGTEVVDAEYVYANDMYCDWLDRSRSDLVGRSFLEVTENPSTVWFPYCYRAAMLGKQTHDTIYSPEVGHWLNFTIAPSPVEKHCVYALTLADDEHRERHEMVVGLDTSYTIIRIVDALSDEKSYDVAINKLLLAVSDIVRCDRLYIMEKQGNDQGLSMTFEWHASGVAPRAGLMRRLSARDLDRWMKYFLEGSTIMVPEVSYLSEHETDVRQQTYAEQGIQSIFLVPLHSGGELIGYLGGDNYELQDDMDIKRLLRTIGSFLAARIASNRLLQEQENLSRLDALTGVLNRRGIDTAIENRFSQGGGERFVLALMDVDDFKTVNDVHGHDVGDEALRVIARRLERVFPPSAIIGRNGGDEFLVMLLDDDARHPESYFSKFLGEELNCSLHGTVYPLSMSIGYVEYPQQVNDLQSAYSKADAALYSVKLDGKSSYGKYQPQMETQYRSQLGFTPRDIAESIPGAILVHEPGPDGAILFANDEVIDLFECESLDDFMDYTGGVYNGVIYEEDKESVRKQLEGQITLDDVGSKDYADYRVLTKKGRLKNVAENGRLVELEGVGKVFYELIIDQDERKA